jgi:hypothetical protein
MKVQWKSANRVASSLWLTPFGAQRDTAIKLVKISEIRVKMLPEKKLKWAKKAKLRSSSAQPFCWQQD